MRACVKRGSRCFLAALDGGADCLTTSGNHRLAHLGIGLCMAVMVVTHFYAIEHIEVAYMIAVKRTSLLFGMLYGAWLFKETGLLKNMLAGVLMVLGVFFIVA